MRDPVIAVLVPCYNEGQTVGKVVRDFRAALPEAGIYVYDNNSTDDTVTRALEAGAVVRREPMQGKGAVVRRMLREVDADVYLLVDGDDTYPAEAARELVDAVLSGQADMAVGDRLSTTYARENKRPFHDMGNKLVRLLLKAMFGSSTNDVMTGYRAFSYGFAKTFPVLSKGFEVETEMTAHAADRRMLVVDVPVAYRDRPEGSESKLDTFRDGRRVLLTALRLFLSCRPMAAFGMLSALFLILGTGAFVPVLLEYLKTGLVERMPTLVLCAACWMSGLLLFSCGLVLGSLRAADRREFEFRLQQAEWMRGKM